MEKWNTLIASRHGYGVAISETEDEVVITDRANGSEMVVFDESYQQSEDPSDIFTNIVVSFPPSTATLRTWRTRRNTPGSF